MKLRFLNSLQGNIRVRTPIALTIALASLPLTCLVRAEVPLEFREPPSIGNLSTGDSRVRARRFHTILVFDTEDPKHTGSSANLRLVRDVVQRFGITFVNEARDKRIFVPTPYDVSMNLVEITGEHVRRSTLEEMFAEFRKPSAKNKFSIVEPVRPGDVVFFWIESEGQRGKDGVDYLELSQDREKIPRDWLREQVEFRGNDGRQTTTLSVFITDSCRTTESVDANVSLIGERPSSPIWRALYFGHTGIVDIASCKTGRAYSNHGISLFALAFRDNLVEPLSGEFNLKDKLDTNSDNLVEWKNGEFERGLNEQLKAKFDEAYDAYFNSDGTPKKEQWESMDVAQRDAANSMRDLKQGGGFQEPEFNEELVHVQNSSN